MYPLSEALGLKPVRIVVSRRYVAGEFVEDAVEHPGFDYDEVQDALGEKRFARLVDFVKDKTVFVCGHRNWPADHPEKHKRNTEVHCFYAKDVEDFLKAGG